MEYCKKRICKLYSDIVGKLDLGVTAQPFYYTQAITYTFTKEVNGREAFQ